jgi:hypothetical protein
MRHGARLVARGVVRADPDTVAALRRRPGEANLSPTFLKYSDEQTVVGLAALLQARTRQGLQAEDFSRWGVVATACRPGRQAVADTLARIAEVGPRGGSPMIIPHRSLHAVSGTVSQALGIKGPNIAVGGGPGHLEEGLLAALTLLAEGHLPGIWLVLTQWDPEPPLGAAEPGAVCHGLGLALLPAFSGQTGPLLRLLPADEVPAGAQPLPGIAELAAIFSPEPVPSRPQLYRFDWGGGLEVA